MKNYTLTTEASSAIPKIFLIVYKLSMS